MRGHNDPPPIGWREENLVDYDLGLPLTLLRARAGVLAFVRPALRRHYVTEQGWRILAALDFFGHALSQVALARAGMFYLTKTRGRIERLRHGGLVEWVRADRKNPYLKARGRRYEARLTHHGAGVVRAVHEEMAARLGPVAARFPARDLERLSCLVFRLEQALLVPAHGRDRVRGPLEEAHAKHYRKAAAAYRRWRRRRNMVKTRRWIDPAEWRVR